jgi:hypothetical protein
MQRDFQEKAMTTMMKTKAMGLALVLVMAGGSAMAQESSAEPGVVVVPEVKAVPEIKMIPDAKVIPNVNLATLDVRLAGLKLQTNVAVQVGYQKDDLFAGAEKFAQGASEVTEINLDPTTMGLVGRRYGREGSEASKMKSMSIHTYKYDKPGMFKMEDVETYRKKLENGTWNCAIRVRTQTGSSDICSRADPDQTNEMVIMTIEPQKLTFIHMSGKMSLDELNDMSGSANEFRPHVNLPNPPKAPRGPAAPSPAPAPVAPVPPNQ